MLRRRLTALSSNPRARDAIVAVAWLLVGLALLQFGGYRLWAETPVLHTSGLAFVLLLIAMVAVATQRSSHPLLALGAGVVLTTVDLLFGGSLGVIIIFTDLIYAAFKYGSDLAVRGLLWVFVGLAVLAVATLLIWRPSNPLVPVLIAQWALIIIVSAMWGWNVRSERLRTQAAMAAEHASATQALRRRIAQDLHDLVANQIAVAGLHVEAAKLLIDQSGSATGRVAESLEQASRGTTQADRQLRRMIHVLHAVDDLSERADAPLQHLLAEGFRDLRAQLPDPRVLNWTGAGEDACRAFLSTQLSARAGVVLRVLQELVANASKHGEGDVELRVSTEEGLTVEATNDTGGGGSGARGNGIGVSGAQMLLAGSGATLTSHASESGGQWLAVLSIPTAGERP